MALLHSLLKINLFNPIRNHYGTVTRLLHGPHHSTLIEPSPNSTLKYIKLPAYEQGLEKMHVKDGSNCNLNCNLLSSQPILFHQYFKPLQCHFDFFVNQSTLINEYKDPNPHEINPIKEPFSQCNTPLEAAKSDIKWRKRRMRRHKLLRWRKKYPQIVNARLKRKLDNRSQQQQNNLQRSWEMYGLTEEPPVLSEEEKIKLQQEWRDEGIWTDPLTIEEYKNFDKLTKIMKKTDQK